MHPLHILEPIFEVVLPAIKLLILGDPVKALGSRVWQVALNFLVILVRRALGSNLEVDDVGTHT